MNILGKLISFWLLFLPIETFASNKPLISQAWIYTTLQVTEPFLFLRYDEPAVNGSRKSTNG